MLRVGGSTGRSPVRTARQSPPPSGLAARLRRLVAELVPFGAVLVVYLAVRFGPMKTAVPTPAIPAGRRGDAGEHARRLGARPAVARLAVAAVRRLQRLFPVRHATAAAVVPAACRRAAWRRGARALRAGRAGRAFGLGWFCSPCAGLQRLPVPIPAAERFLKLPLVGIGSPPPPPRALCRAASRPARAPRRGGPRARGGGFAVVVNVRHGAWRDDPRSGATRWPSTRARAARRAPWAGALLTGDAERRPDILRDAVAHEQLALTLCADGSDPFAPP